jgi:signal transduction histidine kinase
MERLVQAVLDFARARVGHITLAPTWVDLVEVAKTTADELEAANPGRSVKVTGALRSRVCCDGDRIAQIVANLLANAMKFGARSEPVQLCLEESAEDAILSVHNEGSHISKELLPYVFDAFRQASLQANDGLGLGLFIAKAIAVAHGGSIEVRSAPESGTTFIVKIPKSRDECGAPS